MDRVWHILRWVILAIALLYLSIVAYSYPHAHQVRLDDAAVADIQSQKITEADVDGNHLPPAPDPTEANATVIGIDANGNGIRDDVELAIFAKYPISSATSSALRAAELQFAMTEQMYLTKVFDEATWMAVAISDSRAAGCVDATYPRDDLDAYMRITSQRTQEVEDLVFNTTARKAAKENAFDYATSFRLANADFCDIDPAQGQ